MRGNSWGTCLLGRSGFYSTHNLLWEGEWKRMTRHAKQLRAQAPRGAQQVVLHFGYTCYNEAS